MYYYSGIFNQGKKINFEETKSMFFLYKNIHTFYDNNFNLGYLLPQKKVNAYLSIPCFSQNENKNITVIFEGRIYNSQKLLKEAGIIDSKNYSNSHIILKLYELYGINYFNKIEGYFSFAIYDKTKNELILLRDRVGIKPLYYIIKNKKIIFSTVIDTILANCLVKKDINFNFVCNFFFMDNLNFGEETEYKDIYNLEKGHILVANKKGIKIEKVNYPNKFDCVNYNEKDYIDKLYSTYKIALERIFSINNSAHIAFSGGIDSGSILAYAKKINIPSFTYTVEFESMADSKCEDYRLAKERAKKYGVKHRSLNLSPEKFIEEIDESIKNSGRLLNLNNLNSFYIFKWISKYSDFAISGDGIEEQLSLYQYHVLPFLNDLLNGYLPNYNKEEIFKPIFDTYRDMFFARSWQWSDKKISLKEYKKEIFHKNIQKNVSQYNNDEILRKCYNSTPDSDFFIKETHFNKNKEKSRSSFFNKALFIDFNYNLSPKFLSACDLASRLYSIEITSPFFDADFVSFASQIPASLKFRPINNLASTSKYIFRMAIKDLLGDELAFTKFKSGSNIPVDEWLLNHVVEKYVKNTLSDSKINKAGVLNNKYVQEIINEHYLNKDMFKLAGPDGSTSMYLKNGTDHTNKILKLVSFQAWLNNF